MLGRYSRLAARKRDGREQAGVARYSVPLECLYVSFGSHLGTASGISQCLDCGPYRALYYSPREQVSHC